MSFRLCTNRSSLPRHKDALPETPPVPLRVIVTDLSSKGIRTVFTYDDHGRLTSMRTGTDENNSTLISLAYDTLSRLYTVTTPVQQTTYSYTAGATTGTTTTLVSQMSLGKVNSNSFTPVTFGYEYDVVGNISKITESGVGYTDYTYDTVNQLLSAKDYNTAGTLVKEYTYTYDTYGNIRTASDGTTSHTYTYGDAEWLDLLTAYDGNAITYDTSGNPLSYYNGNNWTFTWRNGRELDTAASGSTSLSFEYDQGGIRTQKKVGDVTHRYYYASGKLLRETWTQDSTDYVLDFLYNQNGSPYALKYTAGTAAAVTYYYVLNLQGDVIRLVDSTGATVANYDYDPWGKVLSVTDANGNAITGTTHIANLNPLRYRGYYYDVETGFCYLLSRYYDPKIGRFINADSYASTGAGYLGFNMFAYCNNCPVIYSDHTGHILQPFTMTVYDSGHGGGGVSPDPLEEYDLILNQNEEPIASKHFGFSTVAHGGCGLVAIYNTLVLLDKQIPLEVLNIYLTVTCQQNVFGAVGMMPSHVAAFFSQLGHPVYVTNDPVQIELYSTIADACILWYAYGTDSAPYIGAHFVAYTRQPDGYAFINVDSGGIEYRNSPYAYGIEDNRSEPVGIFIFS